MRLDLRHLAAAGLLAFAVAPALADEPASGASAADNAAMERAQREADGPRRRILEAARLKVAPRTADGADAATAPRSETETRPTLATLRASASPLRTLDGAGLGLAPVAMVEMAPRVNKVVMLPTPAERAAMLRGLPPPQLLSKVDPALPPRLFRRNARRTELLVDLTINADGSVGEASMRESPGAELAAAVLAAVRQWRYDPQPLPRPHVVQIVISPPGE